MVKKLLVLAVLFAFVLPSTCFAKPYAEYQEELKENKKQLVSLEKKIVVEKRKLKKLADEYNDADMALRLELIEAKKTSAGETLDKKAKKQLVRKAKADQQALRDDYYTNKKPLSTVLDGLNKEYHKTEKRIKKLEKKLDRIAEGYVDNDQFKEKLASLKTELAAAKTEYHQELQSIKDTALGDIAAITDTSRKSKLSRKIKEEAKNEEHQLLKEYQEKKIGIQEKIAKIKKENKLLIEREREKVKEKQLKEKKLSLGRDPDSSESTSNFGAR